MTLFHRHRWSLPITLKRLTYQTCLECGSRRLFDSSRWKPGKTLRPEAAAERFNRAAA
ncbi:MAG: hypothetical protein ACRD2E_03000 [Terriglobales bacterium]